MSEPAAETPRESLAITIFNMPTLAARATDGLIYLAIRDLCAAVGLSRQSQMRRLRADEDLREGIKTFRIATPAGMREQEFLQLELVPLWITSVSRRKAEPEIQERLRFFKLHIIQHVHRSITEAAGLPSESSRDIEDLRDLGRYDEAITGIAERQQAMEQSQDKARQAWREHERRIQTLEEQMRQYLPLSDAQQGRVYHLVHQWAEARAEREDIPFGRAVSQCWAALKTRYTVAKYEQIPASKYDDCVTFLTRAYTQAAGETPRGEQLGLDLDVE